ncbi:MAG TPA: rhomboid family intramembrane serine protease [Flavisolibacter sp.]|jgi:membrane associated rhomboid family serine protease|nr:rhomboid family intramembrane serine protease [Flavisolibacter sp.]
MSDFKFRTDNFPPIVKNLIIINVLVFVATSLLDRYMLTLRLAMWPVASPLFQPYQIVTHMFTHGGFSHILFNMFSLWMFGKILENLWGGKRFLLFYLISGIGAAIAHLAVQYLMGGNGPAVGASGAVMGILVAFGYLFPNTELFILFIPFPVKAKWVVIGYIAIDLFSGVARFSGDNIAHFAHLGGALTGFILVLIWNKNDRHRFY